MAKKTGRTETEASERDRLIRTAFASGLRPKRMAAATGLGDSPTISPHPKKGRAAKPLTEKATSVPGRVSAKAKQANGAAAKASLPSKTGRGKIGRKRKLDAVSVAAPPLERPHALSQERRSQTESRAAAETRRDPTPPLPENAPRDQSARLPASPNFEELAANLGRLADETTRATNAYLKPHLAGEPSTLASSEIAEIARTLGRVAENWLAEPQRAVEAQARLTGGFISLWADALHRFQGQDVPAAQPPDPRDQRFKDPAWTENPFFDFVRQSYVHAAKWAEDMVKEAEGIDAHTRHKAEFYVRQLASALAPSNFVALNPELIRQTIEQNGANLVRGAQMFAEDVEAGGGELRLRQTDATTFEVGVNLATTPGKVVFRNELIELIQYAPSTETVLRRPLLIVPPWINKFYILDLNPEKSFIRWAVAQGLTVFVVSWVNPDGRHAEKSFDAYMKEGIFAALEAIEAATGEAHVSAIGYCVGGTLLSATLGYMAAKGERRIDSATLFTTQVDFKHAGDLQVFVDEEQVRAVEEEMKAQGFLDGKRMATAFNMLRPNDLIWRYVVDVYLKGQAPMPFDLLFWNSDSTRMPAANHSFYLRNCYLENNLSQGRMVIDDVGIDLGKVKIPIYNLAAKEDHIAPAISAFEGSSSFGGEVRFVMAGSGHIAGVVNPPAKQKYQYWVDGPIGASFADWAAGAAEHKGSWWPDWFAWIERQAPDRIPARIPGSGKLVPLCDAPGTYVKMKA